MTTSSRGNVDGDKMDPRRFDFDDTQFEWRHDDNTSNDPRAVEMASECRQRLMASTKDVCDRTDPSKRGLILSGGVDTCAILEAAGMQGMTFAAAITVVVGDTSPDEPYARYAAWKHNLDHHIVRMTSDDLIRKYLPKTIETLAVWDGMTIRNSLVVSAAFEKAKELGLTDVLVGDAADELFGGYSFMWGNKDDDPQVWKDKRNSMCAKWTFATSDLARSYGITSHAPYADPKHMVEWALSETKRQDCIADDRCSIQVSLGGPYQVHTTGKVVLREAFRTGSSWRRKDPIEVGSGATIIGKDDYWTREPHNISDKMFQMEQFALGEEGVVIRTKENLVNIRIYKDIFGGLVHPTKRRLPLGQGCVGCCFDIGDATFCLICGAWPAQRSDTNQQLRDS